MNAEHTTPNSNSESEKKDSTSDAMWEQSFLDSADVLDDLAACIEHELKQHPHEQKLDDESW